MRSLPCKADVVQGGAVGGREEVGASPMGHVEDDGGCQPSCAGEDDEVEPWTGTPWKRKLRIVFNRFFCFIKCQNDITACATCLIIEFLRSP